MQTLVIIPGGFHPFHAGHYDLYQQAQRKFPAAKIYIAATDDTSERPFPFDVKQKLARLAGVKPQQFVQVKSPFAPEEITNKFDSDQTKVIFVRSTKDQDKPPQPLYLNADTDDIPLATRGKNKGQPIKLLAYDSNQHNLKPMSQHVYMDYLPTVEFGPGLTSATQIRTAWPKLTNRQRTAMVMSLYPTTQSRPDLANTVVRMLDTVILREEIMSPITENQGWAATLEAGSAGPVTANTGGAGAGMSAAYQRRENQPVDEHSDPDYVEERWSQKYKRSIDCSRPKGFSQRAHCAGRKK